MDDKRDEVRHDRRRFCAGLAVLGASACSPMPSNQIRVGGLDGDTTEGPTVDGSTDALATASGSDDLAHSGQEDLAKAVDMAKAQTTCSGNLAGGSESAVAEGSPVYFSSKSVYLCRDSGGLYAMSSKCTHSGCKLTPQATQFYCNCHGATFDLNGQNPTSPAFSPLKHYAVCVDSSGNVEIDTTTTVAATTRA